MPKYRVDVTGLDGTEKKVTTLTVDTGSEAVVNNTATTLAVTPGGRRTFRKHRKHRKHRTLRKQRKHRKSQKQRK